MTNIPTQAVSFNLYYGGLSVSDMLAEGKNMETTTGRYPPVTEETPHFRNITIRNLTCRGAFTGIYLQGLPELNLENVTLENIDIQAENGMVCIDASDIIIENIALYRTAAMPRILNSSSVDIQGLNVNEIMTKLSLKSGDQSHARSGSRLITPDGTAHVKTIE